MSEPVPLCPIEFNPTTSQIFEFNRVTMNPI